MDDPFQYTKDKRVDLRMYQLQDHMKGTWQDTIREATAWVPLYHHIVQGACDGDNESQWQILGGILYQKGEGDADDICIFPTAHSNSLNISNEIMHYTRQELSFFEPNKCYQYAKVYFFWYCMHQDFVDFYHRCHLCQVNKIPTQVPEGKPRPMPIPKAPFKSLALDFASPMPSDQKCDLISVVLDHFSGLIYLFSVPKNINAKKTAQICPDMIFTVHGYPHSIVYDRDSRFTTHL
jgi:hypothetical protein